MRDRIMGEEIEWVGGFRALPENTWVPIGNIFDKVIEVLSLEYKYFLISNGSFLPNGAKIYHETTGHHLETALPECSGARETLKFDKWSETVVSKIAKNLKERAGKAVFYKKSFGSSLEYTRGCHENYLSEKKLGELIVESENRFKNATIFPDIHPEINYFILFLITRQIFTGSGGVMLYSRYNGTDIYEISPRTKFIDEVLGGSTTTSGKGGRAIINTRNEPLASSDDFWRIHLILGDANMADLSIFLKFGTTSAVIEMIEEGFWGEDMCLEDLAQAPQLLKKISKDLTLKNVPICLKNGKKYTALQIQKKFYENWHRYLRYTNQGGEKEEIAERWRETLDRLEIDDEILYGQLDWKIKARFIWDFMRKKCLPLNHKKIINIDNLYHSPDPEKSFYYKLKNWPGSKIEGLISENEIMKADKVPPETRAKLRVYLDEFFSKLNLPHFISWAYITFKSNASEACEYKIQMPDPRLSFLSSLNLPINAEAIKHLNALRPGAIII